MDLSIKKIFNKNQYKNIKLRTDEGTITKILGNCKYDVDDDLESEKKTEI